MRQGQQTGVRRGATAALTTVALVVALVFVSSTPAGGAHISSPVQAEVSTHLPSSFALCSAIVTSSCISSFLVNGVAAPAAIRVETMLQSGSGAPSFLAFMLQRTSDSSFELSPSLTSASKVTITAKLPASFTPNVATVLGTMDSWQWNSTTRELTIVAYPRSASWLMAQPGCTPSNCPANADTDFTAVLLIGMVDAAYNPLFASKFQGGFLSFNSQVFSTPTFDPATSAVKFTLGAPANKAAGGAQTTSFKVFLPDAVITDLWLLADPATLPATFTRTNVGGIGDVSPTRTRVTATTTSPAGWIFEYGPFSFSVRDISIGPASAPAAANPFAAGQITDFLTCGGGTTTDCIASVTVNGGTPPAGIQPRVYTMGDSLQIQFFKSGGFDLSPSLTVSSVVEIKVNLGASFTPVVLFGAGSVSTWTWNGTTRQMAVTAKPVAASFANKCDIFQCAQTADFDVGAVLMLGAGAFTIPPGLPADAATKLTAAKSQMQGAFFSTNAENFTPPTYDQVAKAIKFRLAAPHFKKAGGLNTGSVSTLIPDGVIVNQWGVADPTTLTGAGVKVDIEGLAVAPTATRVTATATSPAGILIQYQGFSYSSPLVSIAKSAVAAPSVSSLSPTSGSIAGGATVEITGTDLTGATAVLFGDVSASFTVVSSTLIRATAPARSGGDPVDVKVTTAGGTSESGRRFQYSEPSQQPESEKPAAAPPPPPPVTSLPSAPSTQPITTTLPVQLGSDGLVTAPVTVVGGGASMALPSGTMVRSGGMAFAGQLKPPVATTVTGVESAFDFSPGASLTFDRPITLTLPVPAGSSGSDFQPVTIDAMGNRTYLSATSVGASAVTVSTDHLSVFGLARVTKPTVREVPRSVATLAGHHSAWSGQSDYVDLAPGQLVDLAVRYKNTGTVGWYRGAQGTQADLGSNEPLDNRRDFDAGILVSPLFGTNRYATTDVLYVGPGDVGTFPMRLRAPNTRGLYQIRVRPVIEGVTWMEDEGVFLQLTVK